MRTKNDTTTAPAALTRLTPLVALLAILSFGTIAGCEEAAKDEGSEEKSTSESTAAGPEGEDDDGAAAEPIAADPDPVVGQLPGLDRKEIANAMALARPAVRACYDERLEEDPDTGEGRLVVSFAIAADGKVADVEVAEDEVGSDALAACVTGVVSTLVFAAPGGDAPLKVKYPYELRKEDEGSETEFDFGDSTVSAPAPGTRDKASIRAALAAQRAAVKACYETGLAAAPDLAGQVVIAFAIDPDGKAIDVAVGANDLGDESVATCVKDVVAGTTFAPGEGTVKVTYPFVLKAEGGPALSADAPVDFAGGGAVADGEDADGGDDGDDGGAVKVAPAVVTRSLTKEEIQAVVADGRAAMVACYEATLKATPDAAGKIVVSFTVAVDGTVSAAEAAENTVGDDALATCVVGEVEGWTFPPPTRGEVKVNYPFVFAPATK